MKRTNYFIKETYERPVSKKEFVLNLQKEAIGDCVSKAELLRGKTFTETKIKRLIEEKVLFPFKYHSKWYFRVSEIKTGIKILSEYKSGIRGQSRLLQN